MMRRGLASPIVEATGWPKYAPRGFVSILAGARRREDRIHLGRPDAKCSRHEAAIAEKRQVLYCTGCFRS
jgi:hypothetical protein